MKACVLLISLLIIGASAAHVNAQNAEDKFKPFRTGTFVYDDYPTEVKVVRTKKKQVEHYNDGKDKMVLKIEWLNDSTYVLTQLKKTEDTGCLQKGDQILATITEVYEGGYAYSAVAKRCGTLTGRIRKIAD